jgi:hypothetical protein
VTATNIHTLSNIVAVLCELFHPAYGTEILAVTLFLVVVYCDDAFEQWTKGS